MLAKHIRESTPVSFLKWGDGEFQCASFMQGRNCDADLYTRSLGENLISSFVYMSQKPNVYFGAWHTENVRLFWESKVSSPPRWIDYHSIIVDEKEIRAVGGEELQQKLDLYLAVKNSPLKKIIICNELLIKSALIFGEDSEFIFVPLRQWFDTQGGTIFKSIVDILGGATTAATDGSPTHILIFAAGMGSKVLIANLHKLYPNNIYLDFGSALDLICTKRDSRGRGYSYETLRAIFDDAGILPPAEIWDDKKYDYLYLEAKQKLGIHLRA